MTTSGPGSAAAPDPGAGAEFSKYVEQLVADQDARKDSLEKRGLAVITTSGTLVTLVFALVALLTRSPDYELPGGAHGPVGAALVAFVLAGLLALITNVPLGYTNIDVAASRAKFREHWDDTQAQGQQRIVATRLDVLATAQSRNQLKGWLLLAAMLAEVVAVVSLALALSQVLRQG